MLKPLTKRQAAGLIKALAKKHSCTISAVIREVRDDGVPLTDSIMLAYTDGVFYLRKPIVIPSEHLHDPFVIFIDDVPKLSRPTFGAALKLCNELCHVLPLAQEVRLVHSGDTLRTWKRFKNIVGGWVCL